MPKTKRSKRIGIATGDLKDALQIQPARAAVGKADRRSTGRSKRLISDLEKQYRPKEIAEALEITTQKYVSLRRSIRQDKAGSPILNQLLDQTKERAAELSGKPRDMEGLYIADKPIGGRRRFEVDYTQTGENWLRKNIPWSTNATPGGFPDKREALNWYGNVTGGKEYFKIVKGKTRWFIYDTRTAKEKSNKGHISGKTRASRILDKNKIKLD